MINYLAIHKNLMEFKTDCIGALNTLKNILAEMLDVYANIRKIVNEKTVD